MENSKQENRGGVRVGSGRNKLPMGDKKVQVKFWIENKYLFPYGGLEKVNNFLKETLKNGNNPVAERNIQDLTQPTSLIKPITDHKSQTNIVVSVPDNNAIKMPKTVIQYIKERLDITEAADYEIWLAELEGDIYLSKKDKDRAKTGRLD